MAAPARRRTGRRVPAPAASLCAVVTVLALATTGCAAAAGGGASGRSSGAGATPVAPAPPIPPTPGRHVTSSTVPTTTLPATTPRPAPTTAAPVRRPPPGEPEAAEPRRVRIPAIGVDSEVIPLRLDPNRRLIAPDRFDLAGWNQAGPEPGEPGAAVIAGHVDSYRGPAVFYRLRDLRAGDRIHVDRADGSTVTFTVTRTERHPKTGVPDSVYAPTRDPQLRLITCGGAFDRSRRSYLDNLVVHAATP